MTKATMVVWSLAMAVAAGVVSTREARAGAAGVWVSTSGNVFTIPRSTTDFDIIIRWKSGKKGLFKARWVKGMIGTQFTYRDHRGRKHTATFSSRNPNKLRVSGGGVVNWWTRQRLRRGNGAAGKWRSTSGNVFTIPRSNSSFDIILKRPNGQKQLLPARWVRGMVGSQFAYGGKSRRRYTATFNRRNPNKLRVVDTKSGKVTFWRRL